MIESAKKIIYQLEPGLIKYLSIMDCVHKVDVSSDVGFQKMFNGFYRVRQRDAHFYETYYSYMESKKTTGASFEETLKYFHNELGRIEASFSSKLVATINPRMPIWDVFVLENLRLKKPQQYSKTRLEDTVKLYNRIEKWYADYVISEEGNEIINLFDQTYPQNGISSVKKIDFVLWKIRE